MLPDEITSPAEEEKPTALKPPENVLVAVPVTVKASVKDELPEPPPELTPERLVADPPVIVGLVIVTLLSWLILWVWAITL